MKGFIKHINHYVRYNNIINYMDNKNYRYGWISPQEFRVIDKNNNDLGVVKYVPYTRNVVKLVKARENKSLRR